ncbi:MAG TPA: hypothetical protein VFA33_16380 [Bryobacteraceae bacterium]|nr:hypothetical protein [Bryobacteraceae bacterium]
MSQFHSNRTIGARLGIVALLVVAAALSGQAQILNRNLIVNGGAEDGPAAQNATDAQVGNIPHWTTTGGFSVATYGGGDFVQTDDFGPVDRGKQFWLYSRICGQSDD